MVKKFGKLAHVEYVVIIYDIVEAVFAIFCGISIHSIALIGFGILSAVESLSGFIMVRHFSKTCSGNMVPTVAYDKPTLPTAILSFFGGAWILIQSLKVFILKAPPLPSLIGIIIAFCSLAVMPVLVYWICRSFNPPQSIKTAFKEIRAYMLLSSGLCIALCLNFFFSFWKVDPLIGFVTSGFLFKKSFDGITGGQAGVND